MKKITLILFIVTVPAFLYAQVFRTADILKKNTWTLGANPILYEKEPGLFLHAGYGLHKKVDLEVKYGFFNSDDYKGASLKWMIKHNEKFSASLVTGAHMKRDMGIDLGGIVSFPAGSYAFIFTGVDVDLVFGKNIDHYTWIPVGVEVRFRREASFILEADIPMSHFAWNIFGGGLKFYL